jgi:hypothetical protein
MTAAGMNGFRTDGLQTDQFPTASFTLTKSIEVASVPKGGQTIKPSPRATSRFMASPGASRYRSKRSGGDEIEAIGSVDVALTDYAIEAPTWFLVLSIANNGTIELHLLFQPA